MNSVNLRSESVIFKRVSQSFLLMGLLSSCFQQPSTDQTQSSVQQTAPAKTWKSQFPSLWNAAYAQTDPDPSSVSYSQFVTAVANAIKSNGSIISDQDKVGLLSHVMSEISTPTSRVVDFFSLIPPMRTLNHTVIMENPDDPYANSYILHKTNPDGSEPNLLSTSGVRYSVEFKGNLVGTHAINSTTISSAPWSNTIDTTKMNLRLQADAGSGCTSAAPGQLTLSFKLTRLDGSSETKSQTITVNTTGPKHYAVSLPVQDLAANPATQIQLSVLRSHTGNDACALPITVNEVRLKGSFQAD